MTQKKSTAAKAPVPKTTGKPSGRGAALAAKPAVKKDVKAAVSKGPSKDAKPVAKKPVVPAKVPSKPVVASKPAPVVKKVEPKAETGKVAAKKAPEAVKPVVAATVTAKAAATPIKPVAPPVAKAPLTKAPLTKAPVAAKPVAAAAPAGVAPKPVTSQITAPAAPKDIAHKVAQHAQAAAQKQAIDASKKPVSSRHGFKTNEWIVYPAHGVGRIVAIEEQEIANMSLELFVITFEKDKMTLRVPTGKAQTVGMRKLADEGIVKRAMETLKGKARIKRTMWSRRAQEFEAKINSGDLVSIAEVVRDLFRAENQPEQSYSERQLYEAALDRMAREIAAVDKLDERGAVQRITEVLSKSAKGRRAAIEEAVDADAAIEAA